MSAKINLKVFSILFLLIAISAGALAFECYNSGNCASAPPSFSPPPSYAPQNNYAPSVVPQGPNEPSSAPTYTYVPILIPATDAPAPPSSAPQNNYVVSATPQVANSSVASYVPVISASQIPSPSPSAIPNIATTLPTQYTSAPIAQSNNISTSTTSPAKIQSNVAVAENQNSARPTQNKPVQNVKQTAIAPLVVQSTALAASQEPVLVVSFPFNGNFFDFSGNYYGNTTQNVYFANEGVDGKSASFDGATSNVSVSSFNWPAGNSATVMFWMKVASADAWHRIVFGAGSQNYTNRFLGSPWGDGFFYWDYGDISTKGRLKFNYWQYLGKWVHVTVVSGGLAKQQKSIYVNGNLIVQEESSDYPKMNLEGLSIGRGIGEGKWYYHKGLIDEFRVYSSVLSSQQVKQQYDDQKNRLVENAALPTCSFENVAYDPYNKTKPVVFTLTGSPPSGISSLEVLYGDGGGNGIGNIATLPWVIEHRYDAQGISFNATLRATAKDGTKSNVCTYQINFTQRQCTSHSTFVCGGDNIYWQNSCGEREGIKEACANGCDSAAACRPVQSACTETDSAYDPYKYGETTKDGFTRKDSCQNSESIMEYHCNQGDVIQTSANCPYGCSNGACNSAPTCTAAWKCTGNTTREYSDSSCKVVSKDICPIGQVCSEGSCIQAPSQCTSNNLSACYNGNVHWFDSCGNVQSLREVCANGCSSGACIYVPQCQSNASSTCYNDDVYWYNSCNQRGDKREECGSDGCSNGACNSARSEPGDLDYCSSSNLCRHGEGDCDSDSQCRSGLSCVNNVGADYGFDESIDVCESDTQTCDSQDYVACYNNDEYWYDSCGARESKAKECGTLGCSNNSCNTNSGPTCRSNDHTACYLGDAYWFNSCGNMGSLKQDCGNNTCSNGVCSSGPVSNPNDSDGDGFDNEGERLAGSDPNRSSSTPFTVLSSYRVSDAAHGLLMSGKTTSPISKMSVSTQENQVEKQSLGPVADLLLQQCGFAQGTLTGVITNFTDILSSIINLLIYLAGHLDKLQDIIPDIENLIHNLRNLPPLDAGQIWQNYWKGTLRDGDNFLNNYSFTVPCDVSTDSKKAEFRNWYAIGKTTGYSITTLIELGSGVGAITEVKAGMKAGNLAQKAANGKTTIEKALAAIKSLKAAGATDEMIEIAIKNGADIEKTLRIEKSTKGVVWLEYGSIKENKGWLHIEEKHVNTGQFRGIGIADNKVQDKILGTVKNPSASKTSPKGGWCLFSNNLGTLTSPKYINVVVGSNGYIVTAFPTSTLDCR